MDTYIDVFVGNRSTEMKFDVHVFYNGEKLIYKVNDFNYLSNIIRNLSERSNLYVDTRGIGLAFVDVLEKGKIPYKSIKFNRPLAAK